MVEAEAERERETQTQTETDAHKSQSVSPLSIRSCLVDWLGSFGNVLFLVCGPEGDKVL